MPEFTMATDAGSGPETLEEPLEFQDTKAATDDAQVALGERAREQLPNGKRADFSVTVADETGKYVYAEEMRFTARTESDMDREDEEADAATQCVASALGNGP